MFQLKLTPSFARQKKVLLKETTVPHISLPPAVSSGLTGFMKSGLLTPGSTGQLWFECLRAVRPLLFRAAFISFCASASAALSTLAAMRILNSGQDLASMWLFALVYFAMNGTAQVAILYSGRLRCWVGLGAETHLVSLISSKLLRLSAVAASRQSSGNLKTLITSDVRHVGQFLDNAVRNLIPAITGLLVIAPLLVYFSGRPGLAGLIVMTLILPVSGGLNQISQYFQTKSQKAIDSLTSLLGEWVKNIRLIRYLSWEGSFQDDVARSVRAFLSVSVAQHFLACLIFGLSISWWMVATTGVVVASSWLAYPLDLVAFFGSLWLLSFLAGYFTHLPNTIRLYGLAAPSVKRIARLLAEEERKDHVKPGPHVESNAVPVKIVFDDVSFRYPGGKLAVQNLSMEIDLDDQLAIIGEIGSGKTTLLKLLCGELPPTQGRILVTFAGGPSCDLWTSPAYDVFRKHVAYVPQEAFVSSDMLHMNISLAVEASHEDIVAAAYWAELEADLAALPAGLSEEIGESGINLSGGQRQRLNLARAFYSRRRYMVLDDTLSAVDKRTEVTLMERLVARERGFVLVTHRIGELLRVSQVAVMKDGRIVERGDPARLASEVDSHVTRVLGAYEGEVTHG